MKTALQELIELLQEIEDIAHYAIERETIKHCKNIAKEILEKEKQQIIDAYNCGENMMDAEQYYDKTFS